MTSREAFEAWRDAYGKHSDPCAWPAWQAATAAERERCAVVCEVSIAILGSERKAYRHAIDCAAAIRKGPTP